MLSRLHIENFAIAESTELRLAPGFNAITGETGSGKSVLVGALELALGGRASAEAVRAGSNVAVVEATLDPPKSGWKPEVLRTIVEELGLDWDPKEPLTLRREISSQGRSRAMIAGQLVNAADLKRLGELLADLHGQHEHQSLFHSSAQRAALDEYGDYGPLAAKYRAVYQEMARLDARRGELAAQARDFEKRFDYLQFQIEELESAAPREGEIAELESEEARLAHVETLAQAAAHAYGVLYEGNDEGTPTVLSSFGGIARDLAQIERLDSSTEGLAAKLSEIEVLVQDLSLELRAYIAKCEPDPERLDQVVARLELLRRLMRKHSAMNEDELVRMLKALQAERDKMNLDEQERHEIDAKLETTRVELGELGNQLFKNRAAAAKKLSAEVTRTLAQIGMEKAVFKIDVQSMDEFSPHGMDRVEFLIAANIGEGIKPLRDVASGGELSRTMLAIKTALAARDSIPLLVFDEVDAGISGQTAARVGRLIEKLAESHQIICITHHASIAARANHHVSVRKTSQKGRTLMSAVELSGEQRIEELAGMMGGEAGSEEGRRLARKLLGAT